MGGTYRSDRWATTLPAAAGKAVNLEIVLQPAAPPTPKQDPPVIRITLPKIDGR